MTRPVLLIAGGSRGIGASTAKLAAARGYDVAINYKSNRKAADEVAAAVTALEFDSTAKTVWASTGSPVPTSRTP